MSTIYEGPDIFQTMHQYAADNFDPANTLVVAQGILHILDQDPDLDGVISALHIKQQKAIRALSQSFETQQHGLEILELTDIHTNLSMAEKALEALYEELENTTQSQKNDHKLAFEKRQIITQLVFTFSDIVSQHLDIIKSDIVDSLIERQKQFMADGEEIAEPIFVDPAAAHNPRLTAGFSYAALVYLNSRFRDFIKRDKPKITDMGLKRLTGVFERASAKWKDYAKGQNYQNASQANICELLRQAEEQMRELSMRSAERGYYALSYLTNEIGKLAADFTHEAQEPEDAYAQESAKKKKNSETAEIIILPTAGKHNKKRAAEKPPTPGKP